MSRTQPHQRPLSPHLAIYKPSITMVMSVFHRVTGAALFFGMVLIVAFLLALAMGKPAFGMVQAVYGSILGRLVLFGFSWALFHHMLGGLRHLIWDTGAGFDRETRMRLGWMTLIGGLALTVIVWLLVLVG